jgi:glycosyltransferase involved in cell wall biosynthesis
MQNKNILFITHTYNTFQKSQIEGIAPYFDNVYVMVRYKPLAEISRIIPLRKLKLHAKAFCLDLHNKPDNVKVFLVPITYIPSRKGYLQLGDRLLNKIEKIIKQKNIQFDLIHAHYFWTSGYVAIKLQEVYHTPVVITNHSTLQLTKYPYWSPEWNRKITNIIRKADQIYVVNNFMKEKVNNLQQRANIEVIPIGFNKNLFYPISQKRARNYLSIKENKPLFLSIGRLDDNKNHQLFVEGICQLRESFPEILGVIIGEGPNFLKLNKIIRNLNCEKSVKLIGYVPHEKINLWINAANFVVLTSFSEGSPTVMYETLACGKPFLGSKVGGIPEIISSDDYGYLFDPRDKNNLVNKMKLMMLKEWNRDKIIQYSKLYSIENISKTIHKTYFDLLNENR